jgi:hypothetical protein
MMNRFNERKYLTAGVLLFGSIWGMLEATLGIFLHLIYFPLKGAIMFSIGSFLILMALRIYKPENTMRFVLGIGLTASFLKGFDVFLVGPEMMVLRPMIAILIEALAFGVTYTAIEKLRDVNLNTSPLIGVLFAYLSYLGFGLVFTYLGLGSNFWLNKTVTDFIQIIATDGTYAAIICAVTSPLGYWTGEVVNTIQRRMINSRFFYPTVITITLVSWVVGVAVF